MSRYSITSTLIIIMSLACINDVQALDACGATNGVTHIETKVDLNKDDLSADPADPAYAAAWRTVAEAIQKDFSNKIAYNTPTRDIRIQLLIKVPVFGYLSSFSYLQNFDGSKSIEKSILDQVKVDPQKADPNPCDPEKNADNKVNGAVNPSFGGGGGGSGGGSVAINAWLNDFAMSGGCIGGAVACSGLTPIIRIKES